MNSARAKAEIPEGKLVSESGQGHCITVTAGGMLRLICFRSPIFIYLFLLFFFIILLRSSHSRPIDVTHLDALVTSLQPRRPAEEEKEECKWSEREV